MGRKENNMIQSFVEKAKSKKYGSCLVYSYAAEETLRLHFPQKKGGVVPNCNCMEILKDWNKSKDRDIGDADYSTAKHAVLVYLKKSPYVDPMPKNGCYRTYKLLSSEETKEKRLRQKNGQRTRSVSSEGYGSSTGSPLQSTDHLNWESNSKESPINASRTSDYESEIDSPMSSDDLNDNMNDISVEVNADTIPEANISASGLSMEAGVPEAHTQYEPVISYINNARVDQNTEDMTVTALNIESGVSEAYQHDEPVNSAINNAIVNLRIEDMTVYGQMMEVFEAYVQDESENALINNAIVDRNSENMTVSGLNMETGIFEAYVQNEPGNSSLNNVIVDQNTEDITDNMDVHGALQEVLQEFGVDMSNNCNEVLQEGGISDADWNALINDILNENDAEIVERRIPLPKFYKLSERMSLETIAVLTFKPMGEVTLMADGSLPNYHLCEEFCWYKRLEIPKNADENLLCYIEADAFRTVQASQITEIKIVDDHILFFLKPLETIASRNYFPFTDRLN